MAEKSNERGAMSQAIRDYFKEHPQATGAEVVEGLKAQGIEIRPGLVSNVKYNMKAKKKARRKLKAAAVKEHVAAPHAAAARPGRPAKAKISGEDLLKAKKLVDQMGGVEHARQALDLLGQLQ